MFVKYKGSNCGLHNYGTTMYLGCLSTYSENDRGKGYASMVVKACKKIAKRHGLPIELYVGPYLDKPMSKEQLIAFYKKHGFISERLSNGVLYLTYNPKGVKCTAT